MDIRKLRYFIAIAELGSFSRAAEKVHIAQSALSQHVRAMEAALGTALLHRNPRGVTLTDAGTRMLAAARRIDGQLTSLADEVRAAAVPSGEVRFGMPGTISEQMGVPLIEAGRRHYPNVKIKISEAMSGFVLDWLYDGKIELAWLYNVPDGQGLSLHHAFTEEITLFGAATAQYSPIMASVTLSASLHLPLVLPSVAHGLRHLIDTAAASIGKSVAPEIEIDSYRQIKQLVSRGSVFGMLPAAAIRPEVEARAFRSWKVTSPVLTRNIYLGYRASHPPSSAGRAIGQLSWNILKTLVRSGEWTATWTDEDKTNIF